jgi:hypothetical protein
MHVRVPAEDMIARWFDNADDGAKVIIHCSRRKAAKKKVLVSEISFTMRRYHIIQPRYVLQYWPFCQRSKRDSLRLLSSTKCQGVSMLPNITPAYADTIESRQENHSMHLLQADLRRDSLEFRLAFSIIALGDKGS